MNNYNSYKKNVNSGCNFSYICQHSLDKALYLLQFWNFIVNNFYILNLLFNEFFVTFSLVAHAHLVSKIHPRKHEKNFCIAKEMSFLGKHTKIFGRCLLVRVQYVKKIQFGEKHWKWVEDYHFQILRCIRMKEWLLQIWNVDDLMIFD